MSCRVCGGDALELVLDLGRIPLVNNLLATADAPCERFPLSVWVCGNCSLVQIREVPHADAMFRHYTYFSSYSETMVEHARKLVDRYVRAGDQVVEIASNDGYLLQHAVRLGARVLGIDPAENVAAKAIERGIATRIRYFDRECGRELREEGFAADVIFANNVLAHVPDPNQIAAGIAELLAADGTAHIEVPYVLPLLAQGAFDTIYHEHHSYFSVCALRELFAAHDLTLTRVEEIPIHGGSLHLAIGRGQEAPEVVAMAERERSLGLFEGRGYAALQPLIEKRRQELLDATEPFRRVVGYGAAAKGVVLMNVFGLGTDRIQWVADKSPEKQGRFVPGTGQPIVAPECLVQENPDACVVFPWNIADEIVRTNPGYRAAGGRFIVPLPKLRIV